MFKFYCCSDCNMVRAVIDLIKIFIVFRVYLKVLIQKTSNVFVPEVGNLVL